MRTLIKNGWNLKQSNNYTHIRRYFPLPVTNNYTHIQPYSPLPRYNVVGTDTAIVAMMTEVFINIVSGEGGPTLRSIYENVSKNNLFVRVNLSMIVDDFDSSLLIISLPFVENKQYSIYICEFWPTSIQLFVEHEPAHYLTKILYSLNMYILSEYKIFVK